MLLLQLLLTCDRFSSDSETVAVKRTLGSGVRGATLGGAGAIAAVTIMGGSSGGGLPPDMGKFLQLMHRQLTPQWALFW